MEEGKGKREEEGGSRQGKGKVCFGFLLLDNPCSSDYDHGQRCSLEAQETTILFFLTKRIKRSILATNKRECEKKRNWGRAKNKARGR